MAGHQKRVDTRTAMIAAWFEQVASSPEEFSPVVLFEEITSAYVGRKLEVRWTVEDSDTENDYLHCFEGDILEIIPYSTNRPTYKDFHSCKYNVAKVTWDPECNMEDSHVPLNPGRYSKENQHLGWNLVNDEFAKFVCEQVRECRRMEQAASEVQKVM